MKSEPREPSTVNLGKYLSTNKQTNKHTPYWEDKLLRPYGATKKLDSVRKNAKNTFCDGNIDAKCQPLAANISWHKYQSNEYLKFK